jgi:hypothetical protein
VDEPLRLTRGHYLALGEPTLVDRCSALLGANPPNTIAVGTTAAALHQLWLPSQPTVLEFATCEPGRRSAEMTRSRRPEIRTHRRDIRLSDRTTVQGIPATSLARTWWDLAAELSLPDLVAAGDRALQVGCHPSELVGMVRVMAHRRGNRRARLAVELLDQRPRSRPESHLRVAVRQGGLDCFEVNQPVTDEYGQWLAEPILPKCENRLGISGYRARRPG